MAGSSANAAQPISSAFSRRLFLFIGGPSFRHRSIHMDTTFVRCMKDEQGNEVLEYAILMGLIVLVALALIGTVGTKCVKMWNSISNVI
jgi:Flp pilus assembly pilin Flp